MNVNQFPLALNQLAAARMLGVTDRTLRRWTQAGLIRVVTIGGTKLYAVSELERVIREHEGLSRTAPGTAAQALRAAGYQTAGGAR